MRSPKSGFTLLEMLVALSIFAVLGVMSSQVVSRVLIIDKAAVERGNRLSEIQQAMMILQRDLAQINQRSVRDELGDALPAVQIGEASLIEFTRLGWRNPLDHPRSSLQRVAYLFQDETLFRYYWHILDRAADSEPQVQTLLTDVVFAEFIALDRNGTEHSFWPLGEGTEIKQSNQLTALVLNLEIIPLGEIKRMWPVLAAQPFVSVPNNSGKAPDELSREDENLRADEDDEDDDE